MTKRKIVIPLELSEISTEILPVVRHLFEPDWIDLTLIAVVNPLESILSRNVQMMEMSPSIYITHAAEEEWKIYKQGVEERLERTARHLSEAGYTVVTVLKTGDTVQEIARFIDQRNFDLVAMATFGRKGLNRLVYGSIAEQLLRMVSVPMLLMRHQTLSNPEMSPGEKLAHHLHQDLKLNVVVATDGSQHGQQAVALAGNLIQGLIADLKVLVTVRGRDGAVHGQQVMQMVYNTLPPLPVQPELIPLVGPTDETVGKYFETNPADLLVIGPFKDRGAAGQATIGLTAQRLIQEVPMSVLLVKGWQSTVKRILACVAVDDLPVVDAALQLARAMKAELHFLHVLSTPGSDTSLPLKPDDPSLNAILAQDKLLATFLHSAFATLQKAGFERSTLQTWRGDVLQTILTVARNGQYDLIVVGNHSGPGFFADTKAHAVVSYAPHSVLIVRTRVQAE